MVAKIKRHLIGMHDDIPEVAKAISITDTDREFLAFEKLRHLGNYKNKMRELSCIVVLILFHFKIIPIPIISLAHIKLICDTCYPLLELHQNSSKYIFSISVPLHN